MEQNVYICTWKKSNGVFALSVTSRPHICASAPTFSEAEDRLVDAIQRSGGALHAVLEFAPRRPASDFDARFLDPEILLICGDDRFETDAPRRTPFEDPRQLEERLKRLDAFYEAPVCRHCSHTVARRTDKRIKLTYAPVKFDGAFGTLGYDGGPNHQLVSEQFLSILTPEEKGRLEFRPAERKRGRNFFELVGPAGPRFVAVAGMIAHGWSCPTCGHCKWGHSHEAGSIDCFIARADLQPQLAGLFTVGGFPEIELCVTASRWDELVGKAGTRGFVSRPLGVVPEDAVEHRPQLRRLDSR